MWLFVLQQWFRTAIGESEGGLYSERIDVSYRWSMSWFIFSEVMFFGAFFGALFWLRVHAVPNLGSIENALLWPDFKAIWPSVQARHHGVARRHRRAVHDDGPWPLPTINTALLLSSGVTLTIAHHALIANHRATCIAFMWLTVLLGLTFLGVQGYEYTHAYSELNLKLSSGAYGTTFFMLTGFHGFHVFVGMLMLLFITLRLHEGPLHAAAPLRLRRRGLVLALRRRGLARPVHRRLLALMARPASERRVAAASLLASRGQPPSGTPVGLDPAELVGRPAGTTNSSTDSPTRQASARIIVPGLAPAVAAAAQHRRAGHRRALPGSGRTQWRWRSSCGPIIRSAAPAAWPERSGRQPGAARWSCWSPRWPARR